MPNKEQQDHLLEHNYDGIQEFDNPMPRWWVYIFWATIVFSILYWLNVPGIGIGKGRIANYNQAMAAAAAAEAKRVAAQPASASPEQLTAMTKDATVLALGKQTFTQNCAPCHRADAGGQIGRGFERGSRGLERNRSEIPDRRPGTAPRGVHGLDTPVMHRVGGEVRQQRRCVHQR